MTDEAPPVRLSAVFGHPWFREDYAKWQVTLNGYRAWGIVHVDTVEGIAWGYQRVQTTLEPQPEGTRRSEFVLDEKGDLALIEMRAPFKIEPYDPSTKMREQVQY